ncbi:MAG: hypothetical protein M3220_01405, partial [Chloroflexota bacterium]|nr:hypothetical protein [Chloroflexota bacterium]
MQDEMAATEGDVLMPIVDTRCEVVEQPQVVARVLEDLHYQVRELARILAERQIDLVLSSGSGDSWFAAQAVRLAWERYAGVPMEAMQAYEYAAYGRPGISARTAHFVISSSGRPTTTWDALDRALKSPALVIGVTDNDSTDNPFRTRPPFALVPRAVKVGWPTQTTTATIAVLLDLAIAFGEARGHLNHDAARSLEGEVRALPDRMAEVLERSWEWAEKVVPTLVGQRVYTLVGGGPSYAVAQTGASLMAEGPQEVGVALTAEEFHHALRVATLQQGEPVILIAPGGEGEARSRDTARVVREWGARLLALVTPETADLLEEEMDGIQIVQVSEPFSPL